MSSKIYQSPAYKVMPIPIEKIVPSAGLMPELHGRPEFFHVIIPYPHRQRVQ